MPSPMQAPKRAARAVTSEDLDARNAVACGGEPLPPLRAERSRHFASPALSDTAHLVGRDHGAAEAAHLADRGDDAVLPPPLVHPPLDVHHQVDGAADQ